MADLYAITNPGFEDGSTGWTLPGVASVVNYQSTTGQPAPEGVNALQFSGTGGLATAENTAVPVSAGKAITLSAMYQQGAASSGRNGGNVVLIWYDDADQKVGESPGNIVNSGSGGRWYRSAVTATAPTTARKVAAAFRVNRDSTAPSWVDSFQWNHTFTGGATLTYPANNSTYEETASIPFRVEITAPAINPAVKVEYLEDTNVLAETTTAPFSYNHEGLTDGIYDITARVTFQDGLVITTPINIVTVTDVPVTPLPRREYKASNSYAYAVGSVLKGLASAIPSVALITGVEVIATYSLTMISRNKDQGVDAGTSMPDSVFSVIREGELEFALMNSEDGVYRKVGSPVTAPVVISRGDFLRTEDGVSEGMRWSVYESNGSFQITAGSDSNVFGSENIASSEFMDMAIGWRFYPIIGNVPATSERGDAAARIQLDHVAVRVYFDSGSVEYYFLTPDGDVITGTLVSSYVLSGNLKNSDGSGVMQLSALLTSDGETVNIVEGTTIHSAYPPSDRNMIAVADSDMRYNGTPNSVTQRKSRSRTQIITANFYGDERLNSMYGVNGCDRAFAYDGDNFYRIYTQEDPEKDMPRHLAYHHAHLALGYKEGRVDISVAGEPYNFNGVDGASSWGIGDSVTGLLPLSGSILGIFCSGSVVGLSGTTVDNFATQTVSAKMGAVEYTIADMGYPVYANSYGIYTLSQVQQYGDYMGTPLSQDVSPWLRPRLLRKETSELEVVTAWPVRSKNQYRLSFSDGYVLTMTMNNGQQSSPTFSLQRYLLPVGEDDLGVYEGPAIIPAAVSSEIDDGGEERIHIAHTIVEGLPVDGGGGGGDEWLPISPEYIDWEQPSEYLGDGVYYAESEYSDGVYALLNPPTVEGAIRLTIMEYEEDMSTGEGHVTGDSYTAANFAFTIDGEAQPATFNTVLGPVDSNGDGVLQSDITGIVSGWEPRESYEAAMYSAVLRINSTYYHTGSQPMGVKVVYKLEYK